MYDTTSISTRACDRQHHKASASAPGEKPTYTKVYAIASTARSKLRREADSHEHNLRRLLAHANLLDSLEDLRILTPRLENDREQAGISGRNSPEFDDDSDNGNTSDDEEGTDSEELEDGNTELTLVRWPSQLSSAPKPCSKQKSRSNHGTVEVPTAQPIQQYTIAALLDRLEEDLSEESSDEDIAAAEELPFPTRPCLGNGSLTLAMIPAASEVDLSQPIETPRAQMQLAVSAA